MLQRPHNDPDVPFGRIVEARLYWYNNEDQIRAIDCVLYYAEKNLERPIVAGLYDVQTSVRRYHASNTHFQLTIPLSARKRAGRR